MSLILSAALALLPAPVRAQHAESVPPNVIRTSSSAVKPPMTDGGVKPPPPVLDLASCSPAIDVRRLVRLVYQGRTLTRSAELDVIPERGHRMFAYEMMRQLCSPNFSPVQELGKFFARPVDFIVEPGCPTHDQNSSFYRAMDRIISFRHSFDCTPDAMALAYHELQHVATDDHILRDTSVGEDVVQLLSQDHDDTIFDRDDRQLISPMFARTHVLRALDEGISDGVAIAFAPKNQFLGGLARVLRLETQSTTWRRMSWAQKQENEFFVSLVVSGYLGEGPEAVARLNRLVTAGAGRQARSLQELLQALADHDPVEARGRIDRVLTELNAGWDSELEEVLALRRAGR